VTESKQYHQNAGVSDEDLLSKVHQAPDVDVIETLVNPRNEHISLALEMLWKACKPGYCGSSDKNALRAHRHSVSAITHLWFAIEAAVNLTLFNLLKNPRSSYFIARDNRSLIDKKISDSLNKSFPFLDKLSYLDERKECCNELQNQMGKIKAFEALRNALVHGYCFRKDILLEKQAGSEQEEVNKDGKVSMSASYMIGDEVIVAADGKPVDVGKKYRTLGITNEFDKLCRHDAFRCANISLFVLQWLDAHYGVQSSGTWDAHNESYAFYTREPPTTPALRAVDVVLIGQRELITAFHEKDSKEIAIAKGNRKRP